MKKEDCFLLGNIVKLHGNKGEVIIHLDVDSPKNYNQMESVFIELNEELVPFFIESIQIKEQKAVVKFEDVNTPEEAEDLAGNDLYLPLSELPPLQGNSFYFHEIINYMVVDKTYGNIGILIKIFDLPGQPVASVRYEGQELLMPLTDPFISRVDRQNNTLEVDLPEGLVELYLPGKQPIRQ